MEHFLFILAFKTDFNRNQCGTDAPLESGVSVPSLTSQTMYILVISVRAWPLWECYSKAPFLYVASQMTLSCVNFKAKNVCSLNLSQWASFTTQRHSLLPTKWLRQRDTNLACCAFVLLRQVLRVTFVNFTPRPQYGLIAPCCLKSIC